ncbi:MAG TPA: alpha/beta hydrolase [Alphaproteobacteria bacterium]|nr:alpha/beta hydrolase [Alphaproteobacteria bacterium]
MPDRMKLILRPYFGIMRLFGGLWVMVSTLAGCAPVDILNATIPTRDITITRDIAYGDKPKQTLDIYVPKAVAPNAPVIVFFYGGAWQEGDKGDFLFAAQALTTTGAIVVVLNYRVYPEVTFPGFIEDSAAAAAWTIRNIAAYGGDPKTVYLAGHSSGAYNAIMVVLDPEYMAKAGIPGAKFAGGIGISGPYDFLPIHRVDIKPIFEVVPDMAVTQPIHYARADAPPLLLLHGETDTTVGPYNTHNLANRMRELGGRVEDRYYPGVDHVDAIIALTSMFKGRAPVLADIKAFIDKTRAEPR